MKSVVTQHDSVARFAELVLSGLEAWKKAGEIAAAEIDKDSEWPDKVNREHPEISQDVILSFEKIGRGSLHPRLMVNDCPGYARLRRLPYKFQEKYVDSPVELLIQGENGEWQTLLVSALNLSPAQARQVFNCDSVRSIPAQRAWIESESAKKRVAVGAPDSPYRIVGASLMVMQPCKLTRRDLAKLLAEME